MLLHSNGTLLLSHFIRAEHLINLLTCRSFTLVRIDEQPKDPLDGALPEACFNRPYRGGIEQALGLSDEFLVSQAHAYASLRSRTFVMPWTSEPEGRNRIAYGDGGTRCELRVSERELRGILGYHSLGLMPKSRAVDQIPGAFYSVELKEPYYAPVGYAIPVVANPRATAFKQLHLLDDAEVRIEAIVSPHEVEIPLNMKLIEWPIENFDGVVICIGKHTASREAEVIRRLAGKEKIPVVEP